ncbi:hypothetical protein TNCV_3476831 [Trichonephila clavipes]|nr:hypothetical protein TNCV_3476831 [Trichonephila clavipes]
MCTSVMQYRQRKHFRGIDISEMAVKVSKMMNALDVRIFPVLLKTLKRFLRGTVCHRIVHLLLNDQRAIPMEMVGDLILAAGNNPSVLG